MSSNLNFVITPEQGTNLKETENKTFVTKVKVWFPVYFCVLRFTVNVDQYQVEASDSNQQVGFLVGFQILSFKLER